jgi:hypothetical protein
MDLTTLDATQGELAAFLGITDRTLRNLKREIPPNGEKRGIHHVYNLAKATRAYLDYRLDADKSKFTPQDVADARSRREIAIARKEDALARIAEVDARKAEEKVVEIEEVRREVEALFTTVKAKMRAIPNSMASTMSGLLGHEKAILVQTHLAEAIDRALGELASRTKPGAPCDASIE